MRDEPTYPAEFLQLLCVFLSVRHRSLSAVHLSYSAPIHILVLLYFAELSCLCNFLVESVNVFFRPRFDFYQQTILHMRKRFPE
jgi:hypothetical protein